MSDYNFLMESRLSAEQYQVLSLLSRIASEQGLNLYLVGGAVRDLTYGQQVVRDLDFAVEGNPLRILRQLDSRAPAPPAKGTMRGLEEEAAPPRLNYQRFDARRAVADLHFSNGARAELAMSRLEIGSKPGQRPETRPAMIFDSLKHRDFSVNAMAVSLHPNSRGLLLDPTNGAADIERRELRVLHSRSFLEDPLRTYRLLRLGLRLGFKPEEKTQRSLEIALEQRVWERLDSHQQARELRAILQEDDPGRIFKLLAERKLLAGLDKKIAASRIPYDRFAKIRSVCRDVPGADPFLLNFHCLVERLGSGAQARLAAQVVADPKAAKMALGFERDAKKLARLLGSAKAKLPSQIYALLVPQPVELLLYLRATSPRAVIQKRIKKHLLKYSQASTRLARGELQTLGAKPGKEFEAIIDRAFVEQLDGKIKNQQQLVKRLRELAGIKEPPPKPPAAKTRTASTPRTGKQDKKVAGAKAAPPAVQAPAVLKGREATRAEAPAHAAPATAAEPRPRKSASAAAISKPPHPPASPARRSDKSQIPKKGGATPKRSR